MRLHTRLVAAIILTLLSLLTIVVLLPDSHVTAGLQRIALGTSIDHYAGGLWKWAKGSQGREVRVVVLGDSWVGGLEEEGGGWGWVLCQEVWNLVN